MDSGSPWIALLVTAVLIALNGKLASAEIAMMGISEFKLRTQAEGGDKKAGLLLDMKQSPSGFLSTIQIGITLAGLLSGAFAADSLARPITALAASLGAQGSTLALVGGLATFLITLFMTYFMLVFGELVPKRVAMANPEKTAKAIITPISFLSKLARPLVTLLSASTNLVLRLKGIDPDATGTLVTRDEILLMMQEGRQQGSFEESQLDFVSNMFQFSSLRVADIMTHRRSIDMLPAEGTLKEAVEKMSQTGHTRLPVSEGDADEIIGVVYSSDIAQLSITFDRENPPTIRQMMKKPYFVPESKSVSGLFAEMKAGKHQLVIVVDEYGGTSGIVTMMDIIEEIVGELEADDRSAATVLEDGSLLMDGNADMDTLAQRLGIAISATEERMNLSGFVIDKLGYIPPAGAAPSVNYEGYTFTVAGTMGGFIQKVRIVREDQR